MKNKIPVIILAAGSSSRMCGINKIFAEINGVPLIAITLKAFQSFSSISEIYVVTKADSFSEIQHIAEKYNIHKFIKCIEGGTERMFSCLNGINEIKDNEYVLIHDAARPFIDETTTEKIVEKLGEFQSVCCGTKVTDTVKTVNNGIAVNTLDRNCLMGVQTPQGVNIKLYKEIINSAPKNIVFTDDTSVLEYGGYKTFIVEGNEENIKITTPDDILFAEFLLKTKGENICE